MALVLIPLIDCDVLRYEVGSCGQFIDEETDELVIREFDFVSDLFDQRVKEICEECMATEPPLLFLTSDPKLVKMVNRVRKSEGKEPIVFEPNFRIEVATVKPYKGNRKAEKPYHFDNLTAYICSLPGLRIANGMEADDLLGIYQCSGEKETVICSRDKDLKMIPGWHYSWPCGLQPPWGPELVDELGYINLIEKVSPTNGKSTWTIKGCGIKFFYSQLVTGDGVDNIPGLPGAGPKKAIGVQDFDSEDGMFAFVAEMYLDKYDEDWEERLLEQGRLLWMKRSMKDVWNLPCPQD